MVITIPLSGGICIPSLFITIEDKGNPLMVQFMEREVLPMIMSVQGDVLMMEGGTAIEKNKEIKYTLNFNRENQISLLYT